LHLWRTPQLVNTITSRYQESSLLLLVLEVCSIALSSPYFISVSILTCSFRLQISKELIITGLLLHPLQNLEKHYQIIKKIHPNTLRAPHYTCAKNRACSIVWPVYLLSRTGLPKSPRQEKLENPKHLKDFRKLLFPWAD